MLIELANDLRPMLAGAAEDPVLRATLRNLALAFREGSHVITGSHGLLADLQALPMLSEDDRQTYRLIKLRLQDSQALKDRLGTRVVVQAAGPLRRDASGAFLVPYSFFERSARVQPIALVAEHQDDARVYRCAADCWVARSGLPLRLQVEHIGGGGTSAPEFAGSGGSLWESPSESLLRTCSKSRQ